jgi:hypothetical protein
LEDLNAEVEIFTASETIRESIKVSAKESLDFTKYGSKSHGMTNDAHSY